MKPIKEAKLMWQADILVKAALGGWLALAYICSQSLKGALFKTFNSGYVNPILQEALRGVLSQSLAFFPQDVRHPSRFFTQRFFFQ